MSQIARISAEESYTRSLTLSAEFLTVLISVDLLVILTRDVLLFTLALYFSLRVARAHLELSLLPRLQLLRFFVLEFTLTLFRVLPIGLLENKFILDNLDSCGESLGLVGRGELTS